MSNKIISFLSCFFLGLGLVYYRLNSVEAYQKNIYGLQVGQNSLEIENNLGFPLRKTEDHWYYKFEDDSYLKLEFYKHQLRSAVLTYNTPQPYYDYPIPKNQLVKVKVERTPASKSLIVGQPEKGIIWTIVSDGLIKNVSWQHPFESQEKRQSLETILAEIKGLNKTAKK